MTGEPQPQRPAPEPDATWFNRGTALGLILGVLLGAGAVVLGYQLHDRPKEAAKAEPPSPEPPRTKPPKTEPTPDPLEKKKDEARLRCVSIAKAIEAYVASPQNPGLTDEERLPQSPEHLYNVPFGGPSYLRNGRDDTVDPWGKPYQFQLHQRADGSGYILVHTIAPDGTRISQFGIGERSRPKE